VDARREAILEDTLCQTIDARWLEAENRWGFNDGVLTMDHETPRPTACKTGARRNVAEVCCVLRMA
jgi:hypothetical protein